MRLEGASVIMRILRIGASPRMTNRRSALTTALIATSVKAMLFSKPKPKGEAPTEAQREVPARRKAAAWERKRMMVGGRVDWGHKEAVLGINTDAHSNQVRFACQAEVVLKMVANFLRHSNGSRDRGHPLVWVSSAETHRSRLLLSCLSYVYSWYWLLTNESKILCGL